jgi:NTP pyrophosphatase (non-canonical NTP hydrolase)
VKEKMIDSAVEQYHMKHPDMSFKDTEAILSSVEEEEWLVTNCETLGTYQIEAMKTATYGKGNAIIYPTIKLNGEAGEVAEKVGKVLRDKNGIFDTETREQIALEIGDVLWYCAALARDLGYSLDTVAKMNLRKLKSRKERGVISGSGDNR